MQRKILSVTQVSLFKPRLTSAVSQTQGVRAITLTGGDNSYNLRETIYGVGGTNPAL